MTSNELAERLEVIDDRLIDLSAQVLRISYQLRDLSVRLGITDRGGDSVHIDECMQVFNNGGEIK